MGKAKREQKRARRQARGTDREREFREAEKLAENRARRRKWVLVVIPVLSALLAGGMYWGLDDTRAAGIALLLGAVVFFLYGLGTLGAEVRPRDRDRSGSIDFGNRR